MEEKKCLKCGRSCPEDQAFCDECRAEMEKYPVKPGVVVLLPQRTPSAKPPARRRYTPPTAEEQLPKLKKQILSLWLALLLSLSALGVLGYLTVKDYLAEQESLPLPGQNYSSETTDQQEETH